MPEKKNVMKGKQHWEDLELQSLPYAELQNLI